MRLLMLVLSLTLLACQTFKYGRVSDFNKLNLGMSRPEVEAILGQPDLTQANGDLHEEYMYYKKMRHSSYSKPNTWLVTLRDGRVVKWGEVGP